MTEEIKTLVQRLNLLFNIEFALYFVTHSAHWAVVGDDFSEMHIVLLKKQYKTIWKSLDAIAEKIRQLDAVAPYDLPKVVNDGLRAGIQDCHLLPVQAMAASLMQSHEIAIRQIQSCLQAAKAAGRDDLSNYLGGLWEKHGEMRWMLRATAIKAKVGDVNESSHDASFDPSNGKEDKVSS